MTSRPESSAEAEAAEDTDPGLEEPTPDRQKGPDATGTALRSVGAWSRRAVRRARTVAASRPARITRRYLAVLIVTLIGMTGGLLLGGHRSANVGPFQAHLALTPTLSGGTEVQIPPLGALSLDSHAGPLHLTINLGSLDRERAQALVSDPQGIQLASQHAIADLKDGVLRLAVQSGAFALLGGLLLNVLVFRRVRRVAVAGGMAIVLLGATGLWTAASFRPESIEEPRYEGLLTMAPAVVGDARSIVDNYGRYSDELQHLVDNVAKVYGTVSNLPVYEPNEGAVRVLHISDMHLNPAAWGVVETVVRQYNIDLVVDTGDMVDWGSKQEDAYVSNIKNIKVPYVYVRGNHDSASTAATVRKQGAIVLENQVRTVRGLTFAGIGDPRFTPDKETEPANPKAPEPRDEKVVDSGAQLADTITTYDEKHKDHPVDVAMVHDPGAAEPLAGNVPLILAGHLHYREVKILPGKLRTRMMVQGSTGAAGLRGLEEEHPTPMDLSVLYFNSDRQLKAYDAITVGGTGRSEVTLQRHLVPDLNPAPSPSTSGSPGPSGSSSARPSPSTRRR
ncbi:MAG: metallophosphoesterase [Actinocatenispora sp.]